MYESVGEVTLHSTSLDLIEIILHPTDGRHPLLSTPLTRSPGQGVGREGRQGEELTRFWAGLRWTQLGNVVDHSEDRRGDCGVAAEVAEVAEVAEEVVVEVEVAEVHMEVLAMAQDLEVALAMEAVSEAVEVVEAAVVEVAVAARLVLALGRDQATEVDMEAAANHKRS